MMKPRPPEEFNNLEYDKPSRSQLKREMTELQQLGEALAELGQDAVRKAGLPNDLRDALLALYRISKHEARRRHLQYIGKLMRNADVDHVRELVGQAHQIRQAGTVAFHAVERERDQLLDGDDTLLSQLYERYPDMDGQRLRQLVLGARREKAKGKSPKQSRDLFRMLRDLHEQFGDGVEAEAPENPDETPQLPENA